MFPIQKMMQMFNGNPFYQRAQQMASGKNASQIEEICKNICKQRGFDFDKMKQQFEIQARYMGNFGR